MSEEYAARLADAGVPVVATRYLGMIHGFADLAKFDAALIDQVAAALCDVLVPGSLA